MKMNMEHWWNDNDWGKEKYPEKKKICPSATLSTANLLRLARKRKRVSAVFQLNNIQEFSSIRTATIMLLYKAAYEKNRCYLENHGPE